MKRNTKRYFALVLAVVLMLAVSAPAFAEYDEKEPRRASAYINAVYAYTTVSGGSVNVYFAITATGPMSSLGDTDIFIMDSSDYCVAILDSSNTSGLMGYNQGYYSNTISWPHAVSGERYYAIVGYKASNSTGYDTTAYTTNWAP